MYGAGASVSQLAEGFGVHRHTVSAHLARQGVSLRPRGLSERRIEEAVALYGRGWSLVGSVIATAWTPTP